MGVNFRVTEEKKEDFGDLDRRVGVVCVEGNTPVELQFLEQDLQVLFRRKDHLDKLKPVLLVVD